METFLGLSYLVWLPICLAVAVLYLFIIPKKANSSSITSTEKVILRFGHSAVWILLALACLLAYFKLNGVAKIISISSLLVYLTFMFTVLKTRK
jgi:hypothetical protein